MMAANIDDLNAVWTSDNLTTRNEYLLNNFTMSDVTFFIGRDRKRVPGHSCVLVLCSWEFYNVFRLLKLDSYEFIIEDVDYESFMVFLKYCYTLKVDFSQDKEDTLEVTLVVMKLAQRFQLTSLEVICDEHVVDRLYYKNAMLVYKHRKQFSENYVHRYVFQNIQDDFSTIIQFEGNVQIFVDLPLDLVRDITKLSPINCDEMELFDVLMKWAKRNCEKNGIIPSSRNLRMILKDVFNEIRFPTMKSTWFVHIIANYIDMFSAQEIKRICNSIDGKIVNCPGFQCEPRAPIDYIYKTFPFGVTVIFFSGVPDMDNGATRKMIANFCAEETRKLIGFAFVVKKNDVVKVTSCKLKLPSDDWKNIDTKPGVRSKFNWDYDLIAIQFEESQEIIATLNTDNYNYQLVCKFDKQVPNLSAKVSAEDMQHSDHNGIHMQDDKTNTIPYLII